MHKTTLRRLWRPFIALIILGAALTPATKVDFRVSRSQLVTPFVMAVGGADIASASDEDIFAQNPALLTFQQRSSAREGYGKYLDEDLVYMVKRPGGRLRIGADLGMSAFSKTASVTTMMDYMGISSGLITAFGGTGSPVFYILSLAGISFNTNHNPSSLSNITDMSNFISALQDVIALNVDMNLGLYAFVPVNENFAFMVGDRAQLLMLPGIRNDLVIDLAFATQLPGVNRISFGTSIRGFYRYAIEMRSSLDVLDLATNNFIDTSLSLYMAAIDNAVSTFGASIINGTPYSNMAPVYIGTGFSIDFGFAWRISREWRLGAVIEDLYSPIRWWDGRSDLIPLNVKVGATWYMPWSLPGLFEDPQVIMALDDLLFRKYDNIFLKTHAGLRFKILSGFATFHLGLNQGYPSIMVSKSFDFSFLKYTPFAKPLTPPKYAGAFWPFLLPDYVPIIIPFTENETRRYLSENIFVYIAQWAACIVLTGNFEFAAGIYGYENGSYPGQLPVYVSFARLNFYWNF